MTRVSAHLHGIQLTVLSSLLFLFADGQAIANRLTQSMQRMAKRIRASINDYNDSKFEFNSDLPSRITWAVAVNTSSEMYLKVDIRHQISVSITCTGQ